MQHCNLTLMGQRIAAGMAANGIRSESELARRIGVSHQTVRRWLYNPLARIDAVTLFRLSDAVGMSARWIISGQGAPTVRTPITPNEGRLLSQYRLLPHREQSILLGCARDLISLK